MKRLLFDALIVVVVVASVNIFIKPVIVKKTSMAPTLSENDYLLTSRQAYTFGEPKRGDIVIFPVGDSLYIKRVIGLPGEEVDIEDNHVYIDNKLLEEDYLNEGVVTTGNVEDVIVPEGELFLMGDNRAVSIDSRNPEIGTISVGDISGVAFLRLYPFSDIGGV